jgi:hypothetical protein
MFGFDLPPGADLVLSHFWWIPLVAVGTAAYAIFREKFVLRFGSDERDR